jgi:putative ABC transport system permease protein
VNEIFRNLLRRKVRSALTIAGIVIGIFALTTMGSMAEHFNQLLGTGVQYAGSSIAVGPPPEQQGSLLPLSKAAELAQVPGIARVYPNYTFTLAPGGSAIKMGPPDMIAAEHPGADAYGQPRMPISSGRDLAARGEVVLGWGIASEYRKRLGGSIDLPVPPPDANPGFPAHAFRVVGVMAKTGNIYDSMALVGTADAQMLLADTLPAPVRNAVDVHTVAMGFTVFAAPGTSLARLDQVATAINSDVAGVHADDPSAAVASYKSTSTTFTAVTTGAALLALVIGGLSVVNTMLMAVGERVREIGLKKALGARMSAIMRDYLLEAMTIGLAGGSAGYLLGVLLVGLINRAGSGSGFDIFLVTPRLTALALGFAVAMATLAGLFPAYRAARLDPVAALRSH